MKEKQFKGAWLKFIAVLVAVALVIPLAFSGLTQTRAYADDGDVLGGDPTPTEVKATDEELHQIVTNDDFFSSRLALDSSLLEEGFTVEVRDRDTGAELNGYRLAYFDKSVPRSTDGQEQPDGSRDSNDQMHKHADQWFGNDTHIGGSFPTTIEAHPKRYNRFSSDKTGEIPCYSLVFRDEAAAEKAAVHVHYPQIGTYDGKPIGMNVVINNIDAQKRIEWQKDEHNGGAAGSNMWYPAFQIGAKPEGGIIQENIHTADYYVTFFYADTESNQDEGIVGDQIEKTGDIYLTLSSLSMGFQDLYGNNGQYWGPEKVKPITDVTEGFITNESNIFTSFDNRTNYASSLNEYYDVPAIIEGNKAGTTYERGAFQFSTDGDDGYYSPFSGEWVTKGEKKLSGAALEQWLMNHQPGQTGGSWGNWDNKNFYHDNIGHPTFTKNAVSLLYSDSDDIGFRTNTVNNSMWFTIYPQGLTNMTPKDPAVSSDDDPTKSVYPNLENTEIPASAGYRAGETIKYLVTQQANELSYNSIVRYNSFSITDTVPEDTTLQDSGRRVYYIGEKAKLDADGAAITDEDGNPVMETTEIDVTDKGSFSVDGNKLTFTFNENYLHNEMPMRGEIYYMTLETKVNSGLAEGTELVNTVDTNINGTSFPDRTKPENETVGKTTAKVITQEVKYEERLTDRNQEFVYVISQAVPADATSLEITDEIDELLQVVGTPRLVYIGDADGDGQTEEIDVAGAKVTIEPPSSSLTGDDGVKQLVTASVMDGVAANQKYVTDIRGKMLALKIVAKIRKDVTDEQLLAKDLNRIPNQADVKFNNKSKTTNEVDVVPPYKAEKSVFNKNEDGKNYNAKGIESDEFISKGEDKTIHSDAVTPGDVFTYRITYPVPSDAESLRFIDYLDKAADADPDGTDPEGSGGANGVLLLYAEDTANAIRVYGDDTKTPIKTFALPKPQVDLPGGKGYKNVIFTLPKGDLDKIKGQVMTIEFDVMIDPTKSMEEIAEVYGRVPEATGYVHEGINNTAAFKFNNNPWLYTNTVTITTNPEKQVEGDNQKDLNASAHELTNRDEPFTYTVTDTVPLNADRVIMTDTLEEVLEFYSNGARSSEGKKWRENKAIETAAKVKAVVNKNGTPTDVELVYNEDYKTVIGKSPDGINTITVTLTPAGLEKIKPAVGSEGTPGEVVQTVTPNDPENYHKIETLIAQLPEGVTVNARAARGPQTIFVETSDGKYWQSTNEGATWKECTAAHEIAFAQHRIADDGTYENNTVLDMGATITEETIGGTDPSDNIETKITFEFDAIIKRAPDAAESIDEVDTASAEQLQEYLLNDGIPNVASLDFNGTPRVTNEVNVVPPRLGDLTLTKEVTPRDEVLTDEERDEEFTFEITLTREETPGQEDPRVPVTGTFKTEKNGAEGEDITFDENGKATVVLKHGDTVTIKDLPADAIVQYVISEKTSPDYRQSSAEGDEFTIQNGVAVTADFSNIKIDGPSKSVSRENGSEEGDHIAIDYTEVYRYKLSDKIIDGAKTVKVFDELEEVLVLTKTGDIKVYYYEAGEEKEIEYEKADGVADNTDKLELLIKDDGNGVSQAAGRTIYVEFFAKLKDGITPEQLRDYYVKESDDAEVAEARAKNYIPNKGSFDIDGSIRTTNQVTVKPPVDKPEKTVEDDKFGTPDNQLNDGEETKPSYKLANRDDVFTYSISQLVPAIATIDGKDVEVVSLEFTDTLNNFVTFAQADNAGKGTPTTDTSIIEITADGEPVAINDDITITVSGQDLTVNIIGDTVKELHNKFVKVSFTAMIKPGTTDADLLQYLAGTTDVPNEATVKINNKGEATNRVLVTPPPTPEKRVNNDVHYALTEDEFDKNKTFTYEVKQFIPADAATVEFTDNLDPMLDFAGKYTVKADGLTIKEDNIDAKAETLQFTLSPEELKKAQGKTIVVTFDAKYDVKNVETIINQDNYKEIITDNGTVESGITEHNGTPNKATIKIDPNNDGKISNTVTVTPPSTEPGNLDVAKTVKPAEGEITDEGNTELLAKEFEFEVTFTFDENVTVPKTLKFAIADAKTKAADIPEADWEDKAVTNGKMTFTLKHDQVAHIKDVPGKTAYEVVESESSSAGFNVDSFGDEGAVASNVTQTANFVNEQTAPPHPGNLNVNKAFSGDVPAGADDKEFTFTVKFSDHGPVAEHDAQGNPIVVKLNGEEITDANSKRDKDGNVTEITFTITAGDIAKITGIPAGTKYVVEEAADPEYKLIESSVNMEGTITADGTATAVALNKYEKPDDDPVKKINGQNHADLSSKEDEFTYEISQFIPLGTTVVTFEDELNGQLEYVDVAEVTGGTLHKTVAPDGKKISFELSEEECKAVEGHIMLVTVKAKYTADATDATIEGSYVGVIDATEDAEEQIVGADDASADHMGTPNHAKTKVGEHNGTTNTVTVTAPPDVPAPEKKVEGEKYGADDETPALKLRGREETFTYSVTQELPESINLKSLSFSDHIVDVLEFIPGTNANAKIVDQTGAAIDAEIDIDGQKITATPKSLEGLAGKTLTFSFDAKIKATVTDEQLIAAYGTSREIPNEATVHVNGSPIATNEVKVTPPGEDEVPEKLVQADHDAEATKILSTLNARNEEFTYTVNQTVTAGSTYFELQDTIEDVLEFVGNNGGAKLTYTNDNGEEQTLAADISTEKKTLTVKVIGEDKLAPVYAKNVSLTFKAKISDGVTDRQLFDEYGSLEIPNEASVKFNPEDDPTYTNKVKVTPPPEGPEDPEKFVNGDKYGTDDAATQPPLELEKRFSEVTYTVVQKVPFGIARMQIIDVLEHVLETSEDKISIADSKGNAISGATIQVIGNLVQAVIDDEEALAKLAQEDKSVVLKIGAKLRENVTDEQLIDEYGENREIPNTASVVIGNDSKTTNEVKIVPSEEPEEPEKFINDQKNMVTLKDRDEEFVYTVTQMIPDNASEYEFSDQIDDCLTIVKVEFDALSDYTDNSDLDNNLVKFTVAAAEDADKETKANAAELDRGRVVTLTITAKFKDGITDEEIIQKHGTTVVPNEATVSIDGAPQTTNKVEVTPPPVPSEEPEKKVEGEDKLQLEAGQRNRSFNYTVSQIVPSGAVTLGFEDTLESVLEFAPTDGNVTITSIEVEANEIKDDDGNVIDTEYTDKEGTETTIAIDGEKVIRTIDGQKLTVTIADEETVKNLIGKKVTVSFDANIKESVTDAELIAMYGSTNIPNKARVSINSNPKSTNEVDVTPPPTPGEPPEKKVGKDAENQSTDTLVLDKRTDTFTYTVSQQVLNEAVKVTFEDTVESVLEIDPASVTLKDENGDDVELDGEIEVSENKRSVKVVVKDSEEQGTPGEDGYAPANSVAAGKKITLTFNAKIKAGVTDAELIRAYGEAKEIPNKATVSMNNNPKVTNEVLVTPPPTNREDPTKDVEGVDENGKPIEVLGETEDSIKLMNRKDTFTYTVSQVIPNGAVNVQFDDVLERVLEIVGEPTVTVDGVAVEGAKVDVRSGRIVSATVADATAYAEKTMVLTINAKIKDDVTDAQLIALYGDAREIPNEATVTIDGDGKGTNEVLVTPPEEPKDPEKLINDQKELVTLASRDEEFKYTVTQKVPENAKTVTITDTLEEELEFVDMPTATAGDVSIKGQTVTVEIADATPVRGQEVTLTFKAKIKDDVTDAQLLAREGAYKKTTVVPNKAEVKFDFENDPRSTNTVEVTPPGTPSDEPEKKVGMTSEDQSTDILELQAEDAEGNPIEDPRSQVFTYTVSQLIPAGAVNVVFEDTLEDVLEVVGTPAVDADGFTVTVEPKTVDASEESWTKGENGNKRTAQKVTATIEDATGLADRTVTLTINAKIKDGVLDKELIAKYKSTQVPNKATVKINNNPNTTNEVRVTPPPTPGESPEKFVNGQKETYELNSIKETFEYTITQKIPEDAETVEFSDTVENVLEIVGGVDGDEARFAKLTYADGTALEDTVKYNIGWGETTQTIVATIDDAAAVRGKELKLTFTAKIKSDVTREQLVTLYGDAMEIPNFATVTINDNPKVSNTVKVTPPPSTTEEPEKKINDQKELVELENRDDEFTYTVSQKIPDGAVKVKFEDTLERVLEVTKATIDVDDVEPAVNGQTVTAEIADATDLAGKTVTLTIKAKIKDGVTDAQLMNLYGGTTNVPNKATVTIDGKGKTTNEVLVTPPPSEDEPKKKVDGQTEPAKLTNRNNEFTYTVEQYVPANATEVTFEDTLEDVLEVVSASVDGQAVYTDETVGNAVKFTAADASADRAKTVTMTIVAKIKDNITDADLIAKYGSTDVPNEATVTIDGNGKGTNKVLVTPPPTEDEPEKKINGDTDKVTLADRPEEFTYTVSQKIPANAKNVVFTDTLENVLEVVGEPTIDAEDAKVEVNGQTVTATIEDATDLATKTVTLTIKAKIKDGITDAQLVEKYGDDMQIPNKATVSIDGNPKTTNEVLVTPPDEPGENPEKKINGDTKSATLANRDEEFVYTVSQKVPAKAKSIGFEDVLDSCLTVVGTPTIDANGADIKVDGQKVTATIADAKALRGKTVTLTIRAKVTADDATVLAHHKNTRDIPNQATVTIDGKGNPTNEVIVTPPDEKGWVDVRYVTEDGTPLYPTDKTWESLFPDGTTDGTEYTTEQKGFPGYEFVKVNDDTDQYPFEGVDTPAGTVETGKTKKITYIYKKIIETPVKTVSKTQLENREEVFTYTVSQKIPVDASVVTFTDVLENVLEVVGTPTINANATPVVDGQKVSATIADKDYLKGLAGQTVTLTINAKIKTGISDETLIALYGSTTVPNQATVDIDGKGQPTNEVFVTPPPEEPPVPEDPVKKVNGSKEPVQLADKVEVFTYTVEQLIPEGVTEVTISDTVVDELEIVPDSATVNVTGVTPVVNGKTVTATVTGLDADGMAGQTIVLTFKAKIVDGTTDETLIAKYGNAKLIPNEATSQFDIDDAPRTTNKVLVTPPPEEPGVPEKPVKKVSADEKQMDVDHATLASRNDKFVYTVRQVIPKGAVNVTFTDTLVDVLQVESYSLYVEGGSDVGTVSAKGQTVTGVIADARTLAGQTVTLSIKASIKDEVTDETLVVLYGVDKNIPNTANVNIDGKGNVTNEVTVTPPDEPVGSVKVRYETVDGKVLEDWSDVQKDQPDGTEYSTTEKEFPNVYFVEVDPDKSPANGTVTANETKEVVYKYAELPAIDKKVNEKEHEDLKRNYEVFTYTVNTTVPYKATGFTITDEIQHVLRFVGTADDVHVTVGNEVITGAASINGQVLTVVIPDDVAAANEGADVTVSFRAQINPTEPPQDLSEYMVDGKVQIPNTAKYTFTDVKGNAHNNESNKVTVTPPTDEPVMPNVPPIPDLKKYVNNVEHADLETNDEVFQYKLVSVVAKDSTGMVFEDTLVDELEYAGDISSVTVKVGGEVMNGHLDQFKIDGKTLTVALSKYILDNYMGEVIEITFDAKIKAGADVSKWTDQDGKIMIPNEATLIVNNDPDDPVKSNIVTVTPPSKDTLTRNMTFSKMTIGGNEELPGAKLAIFRVYEDGSYDLTEEPVDSWTSTETAHEIALEPGTYVLVELEAPEGYKIAGPIMFRVSADGSEVLVNGEWKNAMDHIVMYDEKVDTPDNPPSTPGKDAPTPVRPTTPGTNTPPSTPGTTPVTTRRAGTPATSVSKATNTGDNNATALWIALGAAAAAAIAAAGVMMRRRRRDEE